MSAMLSPFGGSLMLYVSFCSSSHSILIPINFQIVKTAHEKPTGEAHRLELYVHAMEADDAIMAKCGVSTPTPLSLM